MRALAKLQPAEGLAMIEAPVPVPGPEDVLIRVRRTAICGTDLHIWRWDDWAAATIPTPMIVGHEFSGEIVEIGQAVTRPLSLGQRVSGEGHVINPHSAAARAGRFHLDPDTSGVGVNRPGAFAEYLRLPAFNVVPLPDAVSDDVGALLDPFGNAMHTAQQFELMGEDVLVTGAGPIGVMAAAIARRSGARSVTITDLSDDRLRLAAAVAGGVRTVNPSRESLADAARQEGVRDGFGVAMEMSGAPAAIEQAVEMLAMGGKLALLGLPARAMEVVWSRVILKALTIKGVYGREMFETWRKMFGLLHGGLDLEPLITHRFAAADFEAGFDAALSGRAGKVVLAW
ncbi:L-threonine 3-dehydrogenase [Caulobacter sp. KR2-114]|uniref:L-threonine 3-dehydrogenase n=1 Tax=Caulobacter sp. KR2-114 TaxID=3400912 RepID=UPI003C0B932D